MSPSPNPFEPPPAPRPESIDPANGNFAPCPRCGQPIAQRVGFTLWGGVLGPKLFTHVKCQTCGNKYNGKTGQSNASVIAVYTVGSIVVGAFVAIVAMRMLTI
ncbi:eL43 family ribosomal protein [Roseimaritima ulvae]|uniref:Uncharacterized protein n=1 Tax=Roseimaritima ulvae TaxID=980254 RepID=A0A5B9QWH8_9BACT|nr:hypothetical protein [Roseimaritima ulvae]QEG43394.1 hypothetical protein UC8_54430 [Roseimaritima ulvae]